MATSCDALWPGLLAATTTHVVGQLHHFMFSFDWGAMPKPPPYKGSNASVRNGEAGYREIIL